MIPDKAHTAAGMLRDGEVAELANEGFGYARRRIHRQTLTLVRSWKLTKQEGSPEALLGSAILSAVQKDADRNEQAWIKKIESVRNQYNSSAKPHQRPTLSVSFEGERQYETVALKDAPKSPPVIGRLLFHLTREFEPTTSLEFGTSVGISALYQAAGMAENGDPSATLSTMDVCEDYSTTAQKAARELGLEDRVVFHQGSFAKILPYILDGKTIDFAFIDGHHQGDATLDYYDSISKSLADRSILVFDDINWSQDMEHAWAEIRRRNEVSVSATLGKLGVCIVDDRDQNNHYNLLI